MTSHYLNQWRLVYWCIYASLGLNELNYNSWNSERIFLSTMKGTWSKKSFPRKAPLQLNNLGKFNINMSCMSCCKRNKIVTWANSISICHVWVAAKEIRSWEGLISIQWETWTDDIFKLCSEQSVNRIITGSGNDLLPYLNLCHLDP